MSSKAREAINMLTARRNTYDGLLDDEAHLGTSNPLPSQQVKKKGVFKALVKSFNQGTLPATVSALGSVAEQTVDIAAGGLVDDRELLLEHLVTVMSNLDGSNLSSQISTKLVSLIFNDLPHPPRTHISAASEFRTADGSGNHPWMPQLGAAGQPYARSVQTRASRINQPDPGMIFDLLLRRGDTFKPHPSGISSLLFAHANLIIHDIFSSDPKKFGVNKHSSYLDLQVIYGADETTQHRVRDRDSGRGLLHPDTFADPRLAMMTPASTALCVVYSRNHNYVAQRIFALNESGRYKDPATLSPEERAGQDEDIFQRSRLVNCGFFVNVILRDYIPAILNTPFSDWYLNPLDDLRDSSGHRVERATGNHVSAEFNLLYRWHGALSQEDTEWLNSTFGEAFPGRDLSSLTPAEFMAGTKGISARCAPPEREREWTPHGWKRGDDGKFEDGVIAEAIMDATEHVAGAFGARSHPVAFRIIDSLAIQQSRSWALCTLNEFRLFLGLKPHETFQQWAGEGHDDVANAAEALYGHIDQLELFPGLAAEDTKKTGPGAGLCPGLTISRAILSDAANLVRGDRFFTESFTTASLTSWGMGYATNVQGGAKGVVSKMLFNTLGRHYTKHDSVYALFPFVTPKRMQEILKEAKADHLYTFTRPKPAKRWLSVDTYAGVQAVLTNHHVFKTPYAPKIRQLASCKPEFVMGQNDKELHGQERKMLHEALFPPGFELYIKDFFTDKTRELIKRKSAGMPGNASLIDIVRQVCNVVVPEFIATLWGIPLRDDFGGKFGLTVQELYTLLAAQFANTFATFGDGAPAIEWSLQEGALKAGDLLHNLIRMRCKELNMPGGRWINELTKDFSDFFGLHEGPGKSHLALEERGIAFYETILKSTAGIDEAVNALQGLAVGFCATQCQQISQIVEFYTRPENAKHCQRLHELSRQGNEADDEILGYVYEAMRLVGQAPFIPRDVHEDFEIQDGDRTVKVRAGDGIYASQLHANLDPSVFPDSYTVDPHRPNRDAALVYGTGMHSCLGARFANYTLPAMTRVIFSLKDLRRAPGPGGEFHRSWNQFGNTLAPVYINDDGHDWPFPVSLQVMYGPVTGSERASTAIVAMARGPFLEPQTQGHPNGYHGDHLEVDGKPVGAPLVDSRDSAYTNLSSTSAANAEEREKRRLRRREERDNEATLVMPSKLEGLFNSHDSNKSRAHPVTFERSESEAKVHGSDGASSRTVESSAA